MTLPVVHTTPEATELQALLASMRDSDVATVAMEVSSHTLAQHRVDGTSFAAVCFTNLSHDHLDYHSSLDEYFEAKARLFTPEFSRRAAVNVGDDHGVQLAERATAAGLAVARFAVEGAAPEGSSPDVVARGVELQPESTAFDLVACGREPVRVRTGLVGTFNVANALAAAATALLAGFELDAVVAGLQQPVVVPGRMERVDAGQDFTVLVDYAHTPDALANALGAARELAGDARVITVFGCGGDRDRAKRPLMGEVAARLADVVYVTTDNSRSEDPEAIVGQILAGIPAGTAAQRVLDRRAAIRAALGRRGAGRRRGRRGQGSRGGPDGERPHGAVRRPRRRARRAGGARVMTAADIARRRRRRGRRRVTRCPGHVVGVRLAGARARRVLRGVARRPRRPRLRGRRVRGAAHASRSSPGSIPRSSCPTAQRSCASTTRCTPCRPWPAPNARRAPSSGSSA